MKVLSVFPCHSRSYYFHFSLEIIEIRLGRFLRCPCCLRFLLVSLEWPSEWASDLEPSTSYHDDVWIVVQSLLLALKGKKESHELLSSFPVKKWSISCDDWRSSWRKRKTTPIKLDCHDWTHFSFVSLRWWHGRCDEQGKDKMSLDQHKIEVQKTSFFFSNTRIMITDAWMIWKCMDGRTCTCVYTRQIEVRRYIEEREREREKERKNFQGFSAASPRNEFAWIEDICNRCQPFSSFFFHSEIGREAFPIFASVRFTLIELISPLSRLAAKLHCWSNNNDKCQARGKENDVRLCHLLDYLVAQRSGEWEGFARDHWGVTRTETNMSLSYSLLVYHQIIDGSLQRTKMLFNFYCLSFQDTHAPCLSSIVGTCSFSSEKWLSLRLEEDLE